MRRRGRGEPPDPRSGAGAGLKPVAPWRHPLVAFGSVSFAYYGYAGLFGTYAPLWWHSLGLGTMAIGAITALQSSTRLWSPYAWAWLADHSERRAGWLRAAAVLSGVSALALCWGPARVAWIAGATLALSVCTAAVTPINEAALTGWVSRGDTLDAGRYGRVRVWGSIGFIVAVLAGGAVLQAIGEGWFPVLVATAVATMGVAVWRLPFLPEDAGVARVTVAVWPVLRTPSLGWFFAGVFLTVLAHTSLYAFFSLYLVTLGYGQAEIGVFWTIGVAAEVGWFWFQGRWVARRRDHAWLTLAAIVAALRFAALAAYGTVPTVLVLSQCTHAVTFAAQHSACVAIINRHFPGRLRGRGMALYTVLGYGASGVVGGLAGGALSQACGLAAVFWAASACACLAALCSRRADVLQRRIAGRIPD